MKLNKDELVSQKRALSKTIQFSQPIVTQPGLNGVVRVTQPMEVFQRVPGYLPGKNFRWRAGTATPGYGIWLKFNRDSHKGCLRTFFGRHHRQIGQDNF